MALDQHVADPISPVDGEGTGGDQRYDGGSDRTVGGGGRSDSGGGGDIYGLPEDCVSGIISFTSPCDACRLASVSRFFCSAAQSDIVWERFLPVDYQNLVPQSLCCLSKKELYLTLCDNGVLIEGGEKSFWLAKRSGKKCCMLSAKNLTIIWGDTPSYWRWIWLPEARFPEIAELIGVCWLEIRGKMSNQLLSPETHYSAYLVFKTTDMSFGFENPPVEVGVGIVGKESHKRNVWLDTKNGRDNGNPIRPRPIGRYFWRSSPRLPENASGGETERELPKKRGDGWMEIELGEFFNEGGVDEEIEMSVMEIKGGHWKKGLIVQGIEFRPKELN